MRGRRAQQRESSQDQRLSRMIVVSTVLHGVVIAAIIISVARSQSSPRPPTAYTVELVHPGALGTSIPGGGKARSAEPAPLEKKAPPPVQAEVKDAAKPAVKEPLTKPVVKTLPVAPKQPEVKPVEPPPQEMVKLPDKAKPAEAKPVKPEPTKLIDKPEEKKPEPKKAESKPDTEKSAAKPETKKAEEKPTTASPTKVRNDAPALSAEERDKQIVAALERVRAKVKEGQGEGVPGKPIGSGPPTLGGAPGEGGGGVVRGLEFIMYTEQVKRRVKENWIVTEKRPGLITTIRFGVQVDGEIFDVELMKPSGDTAFDQSALRAVRRANPLPPPPEAYQQEFATQKVEVTFGGEERVN
jgi:TonB family protein